MQQRRSWEMQLGFNKILNYFCLWASRLEAFRLYFQSFFSMIYKKSTVAPQLMTPHGESPPPIVQDRGDISFQIRVHAQMFSLFPL